MNEIDKFQLEVIDRIQQYGLDTSLKEIAHKFLMESMKKMYVYNFSWLGRPIIQYPQDIIAIQEIIWKVKPDLIIETGIAHGGSIIFSASMLELIGNDGIVVGIDIDIRKHNKTEIEQHPMFKRIKMIEGSSISLKVIEQVQEIAKNKNTILVILDSNHTHEHVLAELHAYANLVSNNSYCIILDTFVEDVPIDFFENRPWNVGNNPKTAIWEFLKENDNFEIDKSIQNKLLITVASDGYLKKIK
jgi:cephalosporin hydroxylase